MNADDISTSLIDRRGLLRWATAGIGAVALSSLLGRDGAARAGESPDLTGALPHFAPRAKRVIHLCAMGGVSQVDSFDYKPALEKLHGKPLSGTERPDVFFWAGGSAATERFCLFPTRKERAAYIEPVSEYCWDGR